MEKIETTSEDILIIEGLIYNEKVKIILAYFNCSKERTGKRYQENRDIQKEIEEHMNVEEDVHLVILGDINGRLSALEPERNTDANEQMIEDWVNELDMIHLNRSEMCTGTYTFGRPGKPRNAIDHVIVNTKMGESFKAMRID